MTKKLTNYLDKQDLMIQKDIQNVNCIDSNFLTSNTIYQKAVMGDHSWINGRSLSNIASVARDAYRADKGLIRRYNKNYGSLPGANSEETKRYTDPNHCSRDNSIGYIIMLGKYGYTDDVKDISLNIIKRGSLFQNKIKVDGSKKFMPDLCDPGQYGILMRAALSKSDLYLGYLVLMICDLFMLLNVGIHVLQSKKDPTHTSTVYHMISALMQAKDTVETPFSKLATYLLLNKRSGVPGFEHDEPVVSAMKYYSRTSYDPPLEEIVERSVKYLREN